MVGTSVRRAVFRFFVWRVTRRFFVPLLMLYGLVGFLAARSHHYFTDLAGMRSILSALLAVLLWPRLLLGANLHLR